MNTCKKLLVLGAAVVATVVGTAPPSSAATTTITRSIGWASFDSSTDTVCFQDTDRLNGHEVGARLWKNGQPVFEGGTVFDEWGIDCRQVPGLTQGATYNFELCGLDFGWQWRECTPRQQVVA